MHRIKRNHGREHPRNLVFVDTECFRNYPDGTETEAALTFRLACWRYVRHHGASYNDDEMNCTEKPHVFWQWIAAKCKPKSVLWVFAHNVWFDLTMLGIKGLMNEGRIRLASKHKSCKACIEGSCQNCRCWKGSVSLDPGASFASILFDGKRINFVDSFNFYRSSLECIATSHGLEKKAMPIELASIEEWKDYCSMDVDICKTAVCELIKNWYVHDLGNFQLTAPGLAFSCYRHRFMTESIVVHDNEHVRDDERAAYYGGEVGVYFKGQITQARADLYAGTGVEVRGNDAVYVGPIWHVDCNSLYPHVMREYLYPAMYIGTLDHPTREQLKDAMTDYCVVASLLINTKERTYPFRCDDKIWYPSGRFPTTLCTPEASYALLFGDIERVYHCHLYEKKSLFVEWVNFWSQSMIQAADTGRPADREFCKLMLNSLSGKFAQRYRKWKVDSRSNRLEEWGKWPRYLSSKKKWQVCRALGRLVQVQDGTQYADHALVAISAHITSRGRTYMRSMRTIAGDDNVLYQDTDSMFLTDAGFKRLVDSDCVDPTKVGSFKIKETILEGWIWGRQDYEADGRIVKAGLPKNATRIGSRRWSFDDIESPESMLSRLPDGTIRVKRRIMSGSELCSGRAYLPNGWSKPRDARSIMQECGIDMGE